MFVRHCSIFNVDGGNPLATRLDDIFAAVCDAHEAQWINAGNVSCLEPVVCVHCTAVFVLQTQAASLIVQVSLQSHCACLIAVSLCMMSRVLKSYRGCSEDCHEMAFAEEYRRLMRLVSAACMLRNSFKGKGDDTFWQSNFAWKMVKVEWSML